MRQAPGPGLASESVPKLRFSVAGAEAMEHAAAPALRLSLRVETEDDRAIRSISLQTQIRIAAGRRGYDERTRERLAELFGTPEQWSRSIGSMHWMNIASHVPGFTGSTEVELFVPCTYDFEVSTAKYLHGVEDGEIPLELFFSGSVFYAAAGGMLRTGHITWDSETEYRMPAQLWRDAMDRHFPNSAWIRLRMDVFDRLRAYRAERSLPTWESALEDLFRAVDGRRVDAGRVDGKRVDGDRSTPAREEE